MPTKYRTTDMYVMTSPPTFMEVVDAPDGTISLEVEHVVVPPRGQGSKTMTTEVITLNRLSHAKYSSRRRRFVFRGYMGPLGSAIQYEVIVRWKSGGTREDRANTNATINRI